MKLLNIDTYQKILFFYVLESLILNNYELTFIIWFYNIFDNYKKNIH